MIRIIVFDFDGTLADTRNILLDSIKKNLGSGRRLSREFLHDFGDKPLEKALETLRIEKGKLNFLVRKINKSFFENADKARLAKNIYSLKNIRKKKIILSNSIEKFIEEILKSRKIGFFCDILGADEFDTKVRALEKIIRRKRIEKKEVIYVGDRAIDAQIAKKTGCYSVIVLSKIAWGTRKDVLKQRPDFIINNLAQMQEIVKFLDKGRLDSD